MKDMEESVRRFNIVLGLDVNSGRNAECMAEFFGPKDETPAVQEEQKTLASTDSKNSNKHPKVSCFVVRLHIVKVLSVSSSSVLPLPFYYLVRRK
jgi:hypothetical protein